VAWDLIVYCLCVAFTVGWLVGAFIENRRARLVHDLGGRP
jgi:hypothetical protein